jgi:hypothetical protein
MIKFVTVTGADDSIDPKNLLDLSKKYPFVEWGILLSFSSQGGCRFPSLGWVDKLKDVSSGLNLSGHLCGKYVRDIVKGELTVNTDLLPFNRYQINFHGVKSEPEEKFHTELPNILKQTNKQYIFQADLVNESLFWDMYKKEVNVVPLFDLSHGAGVAPSEWRKPFDKIMCGYAGGLGPGNLKEQLEKILSITGNSDIWIDMETKVRSNYDRQFDLGKVETCLKIAKEFM